MAGNRKWGFDQQWKAQNGRCWICLRKMNYVRSVLDPQSVSVEHIVPRSRGGGNGWSNKLLAHRQCNSERGAPFVWTNLRRFRRIAMLRVRGLVVGTTVEGVDLTCTNRSAVAVKRSATTRRPVTVPSEMAAPPLRVSLAEVFPQQGMCRSGDE